MLRSGLWPGLWEDVPRIREAAVHRWWRRRQEGYTWPEVAAGSGIGAGGMRKRVLAYAAARGLPVRDGVRPAGIAGRRRRKAGVADEARKKPG